MLYIGCHLSPSAGLMAMGETAKSIGANTLQFFTRNPRGGAAKPIDPADAAGLSAMQEREELGRIVAHGAYTINPCAANEKTLEFARQAMADDLARMEYLPGNYYNFHPGSHVGQGTEKGVELICETLNGILRPEQKTTVLLETMAGKGTEIGGRFEELRAILDGVALQEHMGVCLDSCHVYDAGYDIVGDLETVLEEFDRVIGLNRLCAVHLNDSKNPFASHKDRHERIGFGSLGVEALSALICHPALHGKPVILETPNELPGYAEEIALMQRKFSENRR